MSEHSDQLLALLLDSPGMGTFLDHSVAFGSRLVAPPVSCGITFHRDGRPFTAAASDGFTGQVDELQYAAEEGPCLDAVRLNQTVAVDDLAGQLRWSRFRPQAVAHGVGSSLSVPLVVDEVAVGVLNLYARTPHAFGEQGRTHTEAFAAQAAAAVTLTLRQAQLAGVATPTAPHSVDQAVGVLMEERHCDAATALALLRGESAAANRPLGEIAVEVLRRTVGGPP